MKLNPIGDEFENGLMSRRWSDSQRESINDAVHRKIPVSLKTPRLLDGKTVAVVLIHGLREQPDGKAELSFTPIWCMAMVGCHIRSSIIRILVVQFDHGQFEFDASTEIPSDRTMDGPGCDPDVVSKSELALAKLIEQTPIQDPVRMACRHIYSRLGKAVLV